MGGSADVVSGYVKDRYQSGLALDDAIRLAVDALGHDAPQEVRQLTADRLEVAVLDRTRSQPRKFRRIPDARLAELFGWADQDAGEKPGEEPDDGAGEETRGEADGGAGEERAEAPDASADSDAVAGTGAGNGPSEGSSGGSGTADEGEDPSDVIGDLPEDPDAEPPDERARRDPGAPGDDQE